jgi:purine-cytosine permease-like protein
MATAIQGNEALTPLGAGSRVFRWHDHLSLWFSLGVGLLVMQIGAYLVPAVGTRDAFLAIVLGSCIGAGLLAWTARLGCESGLASAGLMHATYGSAFARLPVVLNIVQLIGWTTFELVIMREGTQAIGKKAFGGSLAGNLGIAGIAVYHGCARWAPQLGSALPTLALTFVLAWFTRQAAASGPSELAQSRG